MISIPNNQAELKALEKANNFIVKLNSTGKLTGLVPAYKKVSRWIGHKDEWEVFFIAAKQYHTLIEDKLKADIGYDVLMNNLKAEYKDSFNRIAKIFATEQAAINYLTK
jgi:hypothetical protein